MSEDRIEIGKRPFITIAECSGDLVVRSWAETAVLIRGDQYQADETEAGLTITGHGDLKLTIPINSSLAVNHVAGDAAVKKVQGSVTLQEVSGDLQIANVGPAKLGRIYGDLSVKNVDGGLVVEEVYGDAAVRACGDLALGSVYGDLAAKTVQGAADMNEVMGDINLRNISGDVTVKRGGRDANLRRLDGDATNLSHIAGDIRLRGPLNAGRHTFSAGGDIVFHWPLDADLRVTAVSPNIKNHLPLEELVEEDGSLTGQIGDGNTAVSLEAVGRIILKEIQTDKEKWAGGDMGFDFDFDLSGLGELINSQVMEHFAQVTADFETKFGPEFSEKIAAKAEQAATKAERAAARAARQMEKSFKRGTRFRSPAPPRPPRPSAPPKRKASSEEQLKILKMVEKGVISPDEAGTLLEALES